METTILNSFGEPLREIVRDDAGKPIILTRAEQHLANINQRRYNMFRNALGFEIDITTLTTIQKKVTMQKFFEIAPADYMPVRVGNGAWSDQLLTYRSFSLAQDFESGIINQSTDNSRLAKADAGVDSLSINVYNWGKSISWNIMQLEQAAKAGNWDLVTAKEKARKINWDLGVQRVAFLGARNNSSILGYLTQSGVTVNTTLITKPISSMSPSELKVFLAGLVDAYRVNCDSSAWPEVFTIPESDYLGLASPASSDFPIRSTLDLLQETLKVMTKKDFKILPCRYADSARHADVTSIVGKQVYVLSRMDEESLRMDIPVDYTNTLANSVDNFAFQNVGYGQFTGVLAYRPKEMLYFQY